MKLPVYITIPEVAGILGWPYHRTKRWLKSANALVQRGDTLVTTPERLRDAFPEVWDEYLERAETREDA